MKICGTGLGWEKMQQFAFKKMRDEVENTEKKQGITLRI
jgi:hypothetical protein